MGTKTNKDEIKSPFVYLLNSINGKYFYDVNRNEIVSITESTFNYLKKIQHGKVEEPTADVQKEIAYLRESGYLSEHKVREIRHPATDFLQEYLDRKVVKMTLQVTQSCNLRCSYCIYSDLNNEKQRTHTRKRMSLETAKEAVDFLLYHSGDCDEISISFYGGEPLLEIDLIREVITYAKRKFEGKRLMFSLTSNCTLLTQDILDFFVKEDIRLMVSIDGPERIHDNCRRFAADGSGTFRTVIKNINMIKDKYPDYLKRISVSMVINPQNQFSCINSLFIDYDVFEKMSVHSAIIDDVYSLEKVSYSDDYIQKINYQFFLAYLAQYKGIDMQGITPIAYEELERVNKIENSLESSNLLSDVTAPAGPCIPGQLRLFIDVDGNFFPCERVNENSSIMKIGDLTNGFDIRNAEQLLNVGRITSEECKNCWAFWHCTLCAKYADDSGKFNKEFKLSHCDQIRNSLKNSLLDIIMKREIAKLYMRRT